MLSNIVTSNNLQNLSYEYDKFGNLASRKDNLRNLEETFHYDKMNRLTDIYLSTTHSQIVYDPLGRMTSKQADGQAVFANASFAAAQGQPAQPHAMKSAETAEGVFPPESQTITYTGFDKVKTIAEGGNTLAYTYGYDQQRIRMVENVGDITRTKDYVGFCEFIAEDDGENTTEKTLTYLVGPYGVFAVVEQQDNDEAIHYILKDHLGSWTTITDSEGNVEQELSFDAWGNLRAPGTWQNFSVAEPVEAPMFDRGYIGHEHMTAFGLINMNGRCYDPLTSSFLSVDAYVQDPTSAQAFNRYAYCGYNPLRYTDPTGWYADGYGRQPQPQSYDPTARYHSDDPNDVLWGRSVHPCGNSSSGYVNGMAVTSMGYTEGNEICGGSGSGGDELKGFELKTQDAWKSSPEKCRFYCLAMIEQYLFGDEGRSAEQIEDAWNKLAEDRIPNGYTEMALYKEICLSMGYFCYDMGNDKGEVNDLEVLGAMQSGDPILLLSYYKDESELLTRAHARVICGIDYLPSGKALLKIADPMMVDFYHQTFDNLGRERDQQTIIKYNTYVWFLYSK